MRKRRSFANSLPDYDIDHDYDVIVASFAKSYGIRLRKLPDGDMTFMEFTALLSNLPGDCQLADLVRIRKAEGEEPKSFTPQQLEIRSEWQRFISARVSHGEIKTNSAGLQQLLKSMSRVVEKR